MLYVDTSNFTAALMTVFCVGVVIGMVIAGTLCAVVAKHKGRSVVGWFVLGAVFGLIPLIIVACLPSKRY